MFDVFSCYHVICTVQCMRTYSTELYCCTLVNTHSHGVFVQATVCQSTIGCQSTLICISFPPKWRLWYSPATENLPDCLYKIIDMLKYVNLEPANSKSCVVAILWWKPVPYAPKCTGWDDHMVVSTSSACFPVYVRPVSCIPVCVITWPVSKCQQVIPLDHCQIQSFGVQYQRLEM